MSLYTLGLNHTTAPLEVRERVTFGPDVLGEALRDLTGGRRAKEAAILSTCTVNVVLVPLQAPLHPVNA
jgi:glutamyl-tRNA reductase